MTLAQPQPWEKRPGESFKAYAAFQVYRDLGSGRSIAAAAREVGKSRQLLSDWSTVHGWVTRAAAWDAEEDRQKRMAAAEEIKQMTVRHARAAQGAQQLAMIPVQALIAKIAKEREENNGVSSTLEKLMRAAPGALLELALNAAARLPALQQAERLARGEPTEIVAAMVVEVSAEVKVDEMAQLYEALQRVGLLPPPDDGEDQGELPPLSLAQ